jgi:catechol 2,3-dioxygenase-like lactoylglutathione lyase family enzyme
VIHGVSHIAVGVADIDQALTFYRDVVAPSDR